jgi:hypothetical protein
MKIVAARPRRSFRRHSPLVASVVLPPLGTTHRLHARRRVVSALPRRYFPGVRRHLPHTQPKAYPPIPSSPTKFHKLGMPHRRKSDDV